MLMKDAKDTTIESFSELVDYLEAGCKSAEDWRIGTEHEKFGYHLGDLTPLQYEGDDGVAAMLNGLREFGWRPVFEADKIIALEKGGGSITLEPGGQFELSGGPLAHVHQTCDEVHTHLAQVENVAKDLGIGFIGLGFSPKWPLDETPVMPKFRYDIMRRYMPTRGKLGLEMMFQSCTVQTNLDFSSESDMVKKFRVGLALQPIATAIFANSPFAEGKPSGFLSYRSRVWLDTDPDRTGMLPFVFEDGFGFERYAEYALDVPMYLVERNGTYIDAAGQSFRDFMAGKLQALSGERPSLKDWETHLTTIFPEVRLKRFLEMRGADGGPWRRLCALPAFWVGLLYESASLEAAWDLVKGWTAEEREELRRSVPVHALDTEFRGTTVGAVAKEVLEISRGGLKARNIRDGNNSSEAHFLEPLDQIVDENCTSAERLLNAYRTRWDGDINRIFDEYSY